MENTLTTPTPTPTPETKPTTQTSPDSPNRCPKCNEPLSQEEESNGECWSCGWGLDDEIDLDELTGNKN